MEIRPLTRLENDIARRIIVGYTATEGYAVAYADDERETTIGLRRVPLAEPRVVRYDYLDDETLDRYREVLNLGFSWGAYEGERLVGLLIAEAQAWNRSCWVWEFHVAPDFQRRGLGRRLMGQLAAQAEAADLRTIVCETQNHNVPALDAYRRLGFRLEGIDISYYSNDDYPAGDVAVFMKRRLGAAKRK